MNITINCRIHSNLRALYVSKAELKYFRIISVYVFLLYKISYGELITQKNKWK